MASVNIEISDALRRFLLSRGDAAEVAGQILESVRASEEEFDDPQAIEELRQAVSVGREQLNRGEHANFTAEDVVREGRRRLSYSR